MTDKTYRVGIVGLGVVAAGTVQDTPPPPFKSEINNRHIHTMTQLPNFDLVAVCDLAPDRLDSFKSVWGGKFPETRLYADHKEMLEKEGLDILGVTTGDHLHADVTVDGARSGLKGIFVEKPIAVTLEDADRMIQACEDNGVVLTVDHTRRYRPHLHVVRNAIRDGAIGELGAIVMTHMGDKATLFRNGTHFIDVICFFAESEPAKVMAVLDEGFDHWDRYRGDGGKSYANEPGAMGTIIFRNGVRASYCSTIKNSSHMVRMLITGSAGQFDMSPDGTHAVLITGDNRSEYGQARQTMRGLEYQIVGIPAGYLELVDIIERGGDSVSSAREARKTVQIMTGFLKSHQEGSRLIDVPA